VPIVVSSASGANGDGFGALLAFESDGRALGTFVAVCLNPQCKAEHLAKWQEDGSILVGLKQEPFERVECNKPIYIEIDLLRMGALFRCRRCGCRHRIFNATWEYGKDESHAATE
jgi:hypothetical protein